MKKLIQILIIVACCSCKQKINENKPIDYTGFKDRKVVLIGISEGTFELTDTLGAVSIKLPARLDSFYRWDVTSDCLGCGNIQYRFADKKYQHFKEAGFIWNKKRPDSIYQFTIQHNEVDDTPDDSTIPFLTLADTSQWENLPHYAYCSTLDTLQFLKREYQNINGRVFLTVAFAVRKSAITERESLLVIANTTLRSREYLNFIGECSAKDTTGFIESMYKSFASIQINERP